MATIVDDFSVNPFPSKVVGLSGSWSWDSINKRLVQTSTAQSFMFATYIGLGLTTQLDFQTDFVILADNYQRHAGVFIQTVEGQTTGIRIAYILNTEERWYLSRYVNGALVADSLPDTKVQHVPILLGVTYTIQVRVNFTTGYGELYINGILVLTWVETTWLQGRPGYFCYGCSVAYDNLITDVGALIDCLINVFKDGSWVKPKVSKWNGVAWIESLGIKKLSSIISFINRVWEDHFVGGILDGVIVSVGKLSLPFSPFNINGLKLWLDASQLAGLSDGNAVSSWTDLSGLGNNATQGVSSKMPVYKTNILNGKPVVRFDGVNDDIKIASIQLPAFLTMFVVAKFTTSAPLFIEQGVNANNYDGFYLYGSQGNMFHIRRSSLHFAQGLASWMGANWGIISARYDGTHTVRKNSTVQNNGVITGTSRPNSNVTADLFIASRNESALFGSGDIAEIIIYDTALSTADCQSVETYLSVKYGITLGGV